MPVRAQSYWVFKCQADPQYFITWVDVPERLKDELEKNNGLPCEGSGKPGNWCVNCRFGNFDAYDTIEEIV